MANELRMVDFRTVAHRASKLWLWIIWLIMMVVSVAYCCISFLCFRRLYQVYQEDDEDLGEANRLWAVLTATFVGPFCVVGFFFFGTIILLRKTVAESGLSYSFGALHWSCLWMAIVVMQSGVSLQGQRETMKEWAEHPEIKTTWSSEFTALAVATFVFAYILALCYVVLFFVLLAMRGAMQQLILAEPGSAHKEEPTTEKPSKTEAVAPAAADAKKEEKKEEKEEKKEEEKKDDKAAVGGEKPTDTAVPMV